MHYTIELQGDKTQRDTAALLQLNCVFPITCSPSLTSTVTGFSLVHSFLSENTTANSIA